MTLHASAPSASALEVRAGPLALARLRAGELRMEDIAAIPAAAGGPKGLALLPLDRLLAQALLAAPARRAPLQLIGASIGAWRMAALAQPDPLAALDRLQHAYVHGQDYPERPSPHKVAEVCGELAASVFTGAPVVRADAALAVITARARGVLATRASRAAFARVAVANTLGRARMAAHMERVLFEAGAPTFLQAPFDAFGLQHVALTAANVRPALLASGSIPLVCAPVRDIAGAPHGDYWDGGLIDYHLLLPYAQLPGVVLYPHFVGHLTPGWLDKFVPWRKRGRAPGWLDNLLLVAPSRALLARLPNGKLPDRQDFYRYGADHAGRKRDWTRAIGECERFAQATLEFLRQPDPARVLPLA